MKVAVFVPCFVNHVLPEVGKALVTILESLGIDFYIPKGQTCCGQPAFNAGYPQFSIPSLEALLPLFRDADLVVSPSGSCTAMIRVHGPRLSPRSADIASRFMELTEFIDRHCDIQRLSPRFPGKACIHVGCHLMRMLGVEGAPLRLLGNVQGLELVRLDADRFCCGFGGMFSVKFPNLSAAIGLARVKEAIDMGLDYIISTDPSCMIQMNSILGKLNAGTEAVHIAQVLASREEPAW